MMSLILVLQQLGVSIMMIDLTDKVAIVTGGASGIGRGICLMLAGQQVMANPCNRFGITCCVAAGMRP